MIANPARLTFRNVWSTAGYSAFIAVIRTDGTPTPRTRGVPGRTVDLSLQGRIQSASAGPDVLLHVAASTPAVLEMTIVPPGHVTETSFSPGLR